MEDSVYKKPLWLSITRWTARIMAVLLVAFFLFMFIGESFGNPERATHTLTLLDVIALTLWFTMLAGLLIGIKWETIGGVFNLFFFAIHFALMSLGGNPPFIMLFFILPGILYMISGYYHKKLNVM